MAKTEEESIDDILKSIREAIIDKEIQHLHRAQAPVVNTSNEEEGIFVLSRNMLVKREDIPYQLGVWNFDDVAAKILKKYQNYFAKRMIKTDVENSNDNHNARVRVKEDNMA